MHSPAGSHGDLKLPGGEMTTSDPPRAIPTAIGRWTTTLQQGNLLNLVIPQIAVAALVVAWEEDMFPSTAAMEEARQTLRAQLQSQLTVKAEMGGGETGPFRKIGEGQFKSGPAAVMSADGQQMQVFGLGNDDHFWRAMSTNGGKDWQVAWQQLPAGLFTSPPAAAMSDDGQQLVAVGRGKDNKHWLARSTDRGSHWAGWSPIGAGVFISGPATCCSVNGQRLYVLGTGKDHRVWWALSTDGGQHFQMAWKPIGGSSTSGKLHSAPAAACSDDGQVTRVFGRNADQRFIWTGSDDGGASWTPWQVVETGHFISSPAITMSPDGRTIHLFGIGRNMLLYRNGSSDFGQSWHDSFARVDDITALY